MSAAFKLLGFLAAVAAVFAIGWLGGRAVGPVGDEVEPSRDSHVEHDSAGPVGGLGVGEDTR